MCLPRTKNPLETLEMVPASLVPLYCKVCGRSEHTLDEIIKHLEDIRDEIMERLQGTGSAILKPMEHMREDILERFVARVIRAYSNAESLAS